MDATQILREFASAEGLPVEAIEAARSDRDALVPVFVHTIEQVVADRAAPENADALFWIFHLLGEWREKSAYRPLAALLRMPPDEIQDIFGDASTETSHRVMAAVFDGDPAPIYDIIRDSAADEFIRSQMCVALAMVTLRGALPREQAADFLRACFSALEPQDDSPVWDGWQGAIAALGLVELVPLVKKAFEREFIAPYVMDFADFEEDLQEAVSGRAMASRRAKRQFELFGDTIEEFSTWDFADPGREGHERGRDERVLWTPRDGPAVNPYKNVGRNDPCPCGSGKKYKKCCLAARAAG